MSTAHQRALNHDQKVTCTQKVSKDNKNKEVFHLKQKKCLEGAKENERNSFDIIQVFHNLSTHKGGAWEKSEACDNDRQKNITRKKMNDLKYEVSLLSKQVSQVQQEVQLMLANFSFILELTGENLNRETAVRVQKILRQKNQVIQKQREKILVLEELAMQKNSRKEENVQNIRDRLEEALRKIKELQAQNKGLKSINYSNFACVSHKQSLTCSSNFQETSVAHKKTSDSSNNGIYPIYEEQESPTYSSQHVNGRKYRVKKRNTLGNGIIEMVIPSPPEIESKIKGLGDLRMKIHKLKTELQNGYMAYN